METPVSPGLESLHRCVAGIDVHKKTLMVCCRTAREGGRVVKETREFGTHAAEIERLRDWLAERGAERVVMESTGVYWRPVWNILEDHFPLMLVNAKHVRNVPGRKTDVKDCEWLAQLLQCGLLSPSFVPPRAQRELRDLNRTLARMVSHKATLANRIQKVLEDANIKLAAVATDVLGVSCRDMLRALIDGVEDEKTLADMARRRMRSKIAGLRLALRGGVRDHHRFMLRTHLGEVEQIEGHMREIEARIQTVMEEAGRAAAQAGEAGTPPPAPASTPESAGPAPEAPALPPPSAGQAGEAGTPPAPAVEAGPPEPMNYTRAMSLLITIPGIKNRAAAAILAEIGPDMSAFATGAHLASWAAICPGNRLSAGKSKSGRTRQGNPWLRRILTEAASAARRTKGSYFGAQFRRIMVRAGTKRAVIAVAHTLLRTIHHMLSQNQPFRDLGEHHYDEAHRERAKNRFVKRITDLGYSVTVTEATA